MKRRDVVKTGAALFVSAVAPLAPASAVAQSPRAADAAGALDRAWRQPVGPAQHLFLRGGTILSMDPAIGDFVTGDVLIEGKKIVGVAASGTLKAPPNAQVIDASNTIVIPG